MLFSGLFLKTAILGALLYLAGYNDESPDTIIENYNSSLKNSVRFFNIINQSVLRPSQTSSHENAERMVDNPKVVLHNLTVDPKLANQSKPEEIPKDGKPKSETRSEDDQTNFFGSFFFLPEIVNSWFELNRGQQAMLMVVYILAVIFKYRKSARYRLKTIITALCKYSPRFKPYGIFLYNCLKRPTYYIPHLVRRNRRLHRLNMLIESRRRRSSISVHRRVTHPLKTRVRRTKHAPMMTTRCRFRTMQNRATPTGNNVTTVVNENFNTTNNGASTSTGVGISTIENPSNPASNNETSTTTGEVSTNQYHPVIINIKPAALMENVVPTAKHDTPTVGHEKSSPGHNMSTVEHETSSSEHDAPTAEHETPNVEHDAPTVVRETSSAEHDKPTVRDETSSAEHDKPTVGRETSSPGHDAPTVGHETSSVEHDKPTVWRETSSPGHDAPTVGHETSSAVHDKPTVGRETSSAVHDKPTVGSETSSPGLDAPTVGHETSSAEHDKPTVGRETSSPGHDAPTVGHETSSAEHDKPTVGRETSSPGHDASTVGHETSTAEHDKPTVGHKTSTAEHDNPTVRLEISTVEHDKPTVGREASSPGHDVPTVGHETSSPGHDVPTVGHEPCNPEHDTPTAEHEIPRPGNDASIAGQETSSHDHDALAVEQETSSRDHDALNVVKEASSREHDALTVENEASNNENVTTISKDEIVTENGIVRRETKLVVTKNEVIVSETETLTNEHRTIVLYQTHDRIPLKPGWDIDQEKEHKACQTDSHIQAGMNQDLAAEHHAQDQKSTSNCTNCGVPRKSSSQERATQTTGRDLDELISLSNELLRDANQHAEDVRQMKALNNLADDIDDRLDSLVDMVRGGFLSEGEIFANQSDHGSITSMEGGEYQTDDNHSDGGDYEWNDHISTGDCEPLTTTGCSLSSDQEPENQSNGDNMVDNQYLTDNDQSDGDDYDWDYFMPSGGSGQAITSSTENPDHASNVVNSDYQLDNDHSDYDWDNYIPTGHWNRRPAAFSSSMYCLVPIEPEYQHEETSMVDTEYRKTTQHHQGADGDQSLVNQERLATVSSLDVLKPSDQDSHHIELETKSSEAPPHVEPSSTSLTTAEQEHPSTCDPDISSADQENSSLEDDLSPRGHGNSPLDQDQPSCGQDIPTRDLGISPCDQRHSSGEQDLPTCEQDLPTREQGIASCDQGHPSGAQEFPTEEQGISPREQDNLSGVPDNSSREQGNNLANEDLVVGEADSDDAQVFLAADSVPVAGEKDSISVVGENGSISVTAGADDNSVSVTGENDSFSVAGEDDGDVSGEIIEAENPFFGARRRPGADIEVGIDDMGYIHGRYEDICRILAEMEESARQEDLRDSIQNHIMGAIVFTGLFILPCILVNKYLK